MAMSRHLTLATAAFVLAAAPTSAQTLPLSEAISLGLANNPAVANAALQTEKADQNVAIARTHRLPVFKVEAQGSQLLQPVDISFGRGVFGTFPGIGPVPATDTTVTTPARFSFVFDAQVQPPLTQLFKINLNVKATEAASDFDREQLRDARLALVDQIRRVYYAIAQTRSALDANAHTLALLSELDRVVAKRVALQVALTSDGLNVRSRVAQTELARVTLEHGLASQKEQLNQLLGRDLRTEFDVEEVPITSIVEASLESAQSRALAARPDVREARIKLRQADLAHSAAKTDFIPGVGIAVSYMSPMNIDGAPRQIATAAIQGQWEPWDWGRKRRTVAVRALEIRQAENGISDVEQRALLDVNARFRRLEQARLELRAAKATQDLARENVRVKLTQYGIDAALFADVLQTQASQADSDHQYEQALVSFWTARADFERALGEETTR
jgi:outer membrane protein TolC